MINTLHITGNASHGSILFRPELTGINQRTLWKSVFSLKNIDKSKNCDKR